jgi:hypothetical protein
MTIWQGALMILATVSAFPALYGLYRLVLVLKRRGWLSWRNQRGGRSAVSSFVAIHQLIEPNVQHVQEVKLQRRRGEHTPGADEP